MNGGLIRHTRIKVGYNIKMNLEAGRFTLVEFAIYTFLLIEGGLHRGNASTIALALGAFSKRATIERALRSLQKKGLIHYVSKDRTGMYYIGVEEVEGLNVVPPEFYTAADKAEIASWSE